jgi:hypothetical protein
MAQHMSGPPGLAGQVSPITGALEAWAAQSPRCSTVPVRV